MHNHHSFGVPACQHVEAVNAVLLPNCKQLCWGALVGPLNIWGPVQLYQ
jgi:hypothetical protein